MGLTFDEWVADATLFDRAWTVWGDLEIYCRVALHRCLGDMLTTIDIANVGITEESKKGQGQFTEFVRHVESIAKERGWAVYVESIANDRLTGFLMRRGYKNVEADPVMPIVSTLYLPAGGRIYE